MTGRGFEYNLYGKPPQVGILLVRLNPNLRGVIEPIVDPRPSRQQTIILRYLDPTTVFTPSTYVAPADERTGRLFVFRTFDRVSYAVVLNTADPIRPGDFARKP